MLPPLSLSLSLSLSFNGSCYVPFISIGFLVSFLLLPSPPLPFCLPLNFSVHHFYLHAATYDDGGNLFAAVFDVTDVVAPAVMLTNIAVVNDYAAATADAYRLSRYRRCYSLCYYLCCCCGDGTYLLILLLLPAIA